MRKTILFVCYGLGIGGIEKCLVNLINSLSEEKYEIDLLLMNPEFALKSGIHRQVNFIDTFRYVMNTTDTLPAIQAQGGIGRHPWWFIRYCFFRLLNKAQWNCWRVFRSLPKHYDVAVAYSHHDYSKYYVIDKVKADRKYLFYHDGVYKLPFSHEKRDRVYFQKFTNVIAVSKCTKDMLAEKYIQLEPRILVLHNVIDQKEIIEKAQETVLEKQSGVFYITTVGRLIGQKQPLVAVEIAHMLRRDGYNFIWQWIGDGGQRAEVVNKIEQDTLAECFILRGDQRNPYVYMKQCDLYVQPSHDEAFCTATNEARILGKVIVTTNCSGMDEQIEDGVTGFIVQNDVSELYRAIKHLMDHRDILDEMQKNIHIGKDDLSYVSEYEKLF